MNIMIEIKLGGNHCSARSDDSTMMTLILIVFFFFIPSISENVTVICQASNISVAIQKSLFTDTNVTFAATDLALNDRDCHATNGSNTFDFDITHGTCNTEFTISKDEERSFYHNVVFDTEADPDDPEFDIICSYSSKYVKLVFRA